MRVRLRVCVFACAFVCVCVRLRVRLRAFACVCVRLRAIACVRRASYFRAASVVRRGAVLSLAVLAANDAVDDDIDDDGHDNRGDGGGDDHDDGGDSGSGYDDNNYDDVQVRHNEAECDVAVYELRQPAQVAFLSLSTAFHDGNHAQVLYFHCYDFCCCCYYF